METKPTPEESVSSLDQFKRFVRRAWRTLGRIAWVVLVLFFTQNALASRLENEPRAALLYWMITAVVVLAGGINSLNRRIRLGETTFQRGEKTNK
jgi:hypothetical protein